MTDIGDWDMGGDQADADAPTPVINGGLLDPRTFPSPWPPAAQPASQTPPPSDDDWLNPPPPPPGSPDARVYAEVLNDIRNAHAKLPPIGAQPADDVGSYGDDWLERPPPLIKRGLDTDTHAEVLQDILNAQAKLPPIQAPQDDNSLVINGQKYSVLKARTFDPARSYGQTAMPDADMVAAGITGAPTVAVPYGRAEKLTYMIPFPTPPTSADVDPMTGLATTLNMKPMVFMPSTGGATTGSGNGADTATMKPFDNAVAGIHGHVDVNKDDSENSSNGMVDDVSANDGYGDTQSSAWEKRPIPMATVSKGLVGWHGLDKGQLKFIYPEGALNSDQVWRMQQNLDAEQYKFMRPK